MSCVEYVASISVMASLSALVVGVLVGLIIVYCGGRK